MRQRRNVVIAAAALGLLALVTRHPSADIRLMTHDANDPAPHSMRAAIDLGLVGVSVLYTWTARRVG